VGDTVPSSTSRPPAMSVTTIVIAGFPADAPMRERKNAARLLAGFESAHCNLKSGTVFAKFDTPESAQAAVDFLSTNPYDMDDEGAGGLKCELAKRDLEVRDTPQKKPVAFGKGGALTAPAMAPMPRMAPAPAPFYSAPAYSGQPAYTGPPASGVDTVAVTKISLQGWTPESVNDLFGNMPGFVVCQYNERIDGCFVKFNNARAAAAAVQKGGAAGVQAQLAKRSLELEGKGGGKGAVAPAPSYPSYDSWSAAPPAKKPRTDAPAGGVDTLALMKVSSQGLTPDGVAATFANMTGYVTYQHNERIDGCFIKFTDAAAAARAKLQAASLGLEVELARRSLQVIN